MNKGFFLVLEGCEGTGKSTVVKWLKTELEKQGYNVYLTREPGGNGSPVAEKIRSIILDKENNVLPLTEAYLFAASRAQHVQEIILPHLERGEMVICDRFVYSSYAYQGEGRKLGLENVTKINKFATEDCQPNLVLLFDLEPQIGLQRKLQGRQDFDRLDNETLEFHTRVRKTYLKLARENPQLFRVINVKQLIEKVQTDTWKELINKIKEINYDKN
ncbi:MAG: dTMP kinase [Candidatus Paceibacterota bacterium]|jgi:dTMP kinase